MGQLGARESVVSRMDPVPELRSLVSLLLTERVALMEQDGSGYKSRLGIGRTGVQMRSLPLTGCLTLGRSLSLPYLSNEAQVSMILCRGWDILSPKLAYSK